MRSLCASAVLILAIAAGGLTTARSVSAGRRPEACGVDAAPQVPLWQQRLQLWLRAVARHEPGTADDAAREIALAPGAALTTLVGDLISLGDLLARAHARAAGSGDRPLITYGERQFTIVEVQEWLGLTDQEAARGDLTRVLRRGVLLHTDIAVLVPPDDRPRIGRPEVIMLRDGRQDSIGYSQGAHWRFARELFDALRPNPAQDSTVQQWYRAAGAYLLNRGDLGEAGAHLDRARRLFPDDTDIWFYSGCVRETLASPPVQQALQSLVLPSGRARVDTASAKSHLEAAAAFFRRAVQLDAGLAEARVRLAHVTALLDDHDEAARQLPQAATTSDSLVTYYAAMLLGLEEEARNRRGEARACYERAASLYPGAQSPLLALSQLALRFGDRDGALAAAQSIARLPADPPQRFDPWAAYYYSGGRRADALLDAWRRALAAATRQ
jgi:tetratricopeptide (TPR) repeat protein